MMTTFMRQAQPEASTASSAARQVWEAFTPLVTSGALAEDFAALVPPTPLHELPQEAWPADLRGSGYTVYVKRDDLTEGGAYKRRGAASRLLRIPEARRSRTTVYGASTGNHGRVTAEVARALGFAGTVIYLPNGASGVKQQAIAAAGAISQYRPTLAESLKAAQQAGKQEGNVFVHPYDDPYVVAGQGKAAEEMIGQLQAMDVDPARATMLFAAGGGGLATGNAVAARGLLPHSSVRFVQSVGASDLASARLGRVFDPASFSDAVDGAAVLKGGTLARSVLLSPAYTQGAHIVQNREVAEAMYALSGLGVIEPAGALALAGAFQLMRSREGVPGVLAVHCSGGNVTQDKIAEFARYGYEGRTLSGQQAVQMVSRAHLVRKLAGLEEVIAAASGNSSRRHGLRAINGSAAYL